jgi:hypothetical protein
MFQNFFIFAFLLATVAAFTPSSQRAISNVALFAKWPLGDKVNFVPKPYQFPLEKKAAPQATKEGIIKKSKPTGFFKSLGKKK